ncbi:hypothetical protein PMAYCL1PPCAC_12474, partial [Pristionchus mayeri]
SPPPSPNGKSPSRSGHMRGILLLLSLIILALLIGGLVLFRLHSSEGEDPSIPLPHNDSNAYVDPPEAVPIVGRPNQMGNAATERPTSPTTTLPTTTSTTVRPTTVTFPGGHAEVVIDGDEVRKDQ